MAATLCTVVLYRLLLTALLHWCSVDAALTLNQPVCSSHQSIGECLVFRQQHSCVWDVASTSCVDDTPCEKRTKTQCTFELTTGSRAKWDLTVNKCFWHSADNACCWSDECPKHVHRDGCRESGCSWSQVCPPQGHSFEPGLHCKYVCEASLEDARIPSVTRSVFPSHPSTASWMETESLTPVVSLPAGDTQGLQGNAIDTYLGLPFAAAPVGTLRWAAPEKLPRWNGTFKATQFGARCNQASSHYLLHNDACKGNTRGVCVGYSEDCLNLNVYAPKTSGSKPTLVWIHGGCFVSGSSASAAYNGSQLAASQNVVVVTVNYRLSAMGWIAHDSLRYRDPSGSTGNYGLLDNIAALQWIQNNIPYLGGDPTRVTIFGESSGAGSVSQLLGVQAAWPYFHRGIMESGGASYWTYMDMSAAYQKFNEVVEHAQCNASEAIDSTLSCLLDAPSSALVADSVYCRDGCAWTPVIDGVAVMGQTIHLAQTGKLRTDTPIIVGYNLNDGASFVPGSHNMSRDQLAQYFSERYGPNRAAQLEKLYPIPAKSQTPVFSREFMSAQSCETDWDYACDSQFLANAFAGPAYVYQFSQVSSTGTVFHGDEIKYVFGHVSGEEDLQVSQMTMAWWANFARTGDPNGNGLPMWPVWSSNKQTLLNISINSNIVTNPNADGCAFFSENWNYFKSCLPPNPDSSAMYPAHPANHNRMPSMIV